MRAWSFRVKVGVYSALLTTSALMAGAAVMLVALYFHELGEIDSEIRDDAEELVWDLGKFRDVSSDTSAPIRDEHIPVTLSGCHLVVESPEGHVIYRSKNLNGENLEAKIGQPESRPIHGKLSRVGAFRIDPYVIRIGMRQQMLQRYLKNLGIGLVASLPVVALVVFFGGVWLARRTTAPLAELGDAAERINAGNPEERLPLPPARDEIAKLTEVLNRSFDRLHRSYDAAARFSADASHQLKTPLAILRAGLDHLSRETILTEAQAAEVASLRHQTRRLNSLIEDLLLLAQADAGRMNLQVETLDLSELLAAAVDDLEVLCSDGDIRQEKDITGPLPVSADRRLMGMVLQNLIENAAKYTPAGGLIRVSAGDEGGMAVVRVGNTGGTIPAAERSGIFERFRRGSSVGGAVAGHGLGLNIARELIRAHRGDLVINDTPEDWVEFEFRLPLEEVHSGI
jgi:signal transduction histidine kinase